MKLTVHSKISSVKNVKKFVTSDDEEYSDYPKKQEKKGKKQKNKKLN